MEFDGEGLQLVVSGIETENEALLAAGFGATVIGFDLFPSHHQLTPSEVHDIIRRIPVGVHTMGVFRSELPERVCDIANRVGLHAVELRGSFSPSQIAYIADRVRTVVRTVSIDRLSVAGGLDAVDYVAVPEEDDFDAWLASVDWVRDAGRDIRILARGVGAGPVADVVRGLPVTGVVAGETVRTITGRLDSWALFEFLTNAHDAYEAPWAEG